MKTIQIEVDEKNVEAITTLLGQLKSGLIHKVSVCEDCHPTIDAHGLNDTHEHKEHVKSKIEDIEHHISLLNKAVHKL
jgi:hypothetical protein